MSNIRDATVAPHSACKSCGEPIRWATTVRRKAMPLDPEPVEQGNVDLQWIDAEEIAIVLGPLEAEAARGAGRELYVSHFATCPHGPAHRKAAA